VKLLSQTRNFFGIEFQANLNQLESFLRPVGVLTTRPARASEMLRSALMTTLLMICEVVNAGEYPLHTAAMNDDVSEVKSLLDSLEKGRVVPALHELDNNGMQPLHIAAYNGAGNAIKLLADFGANLEDVTSRGNMTALHWAAARAQINALKALVKAGANIEAKDDGSKTPLHFAASRGHMEILNALLTAGANTEAQTANSVTPLQMAAEKAQTEAILALVNAGANVQAAADPGKMTPLHAACYSGHMHAPEAVRALLNAGAKLDAMNDQGKTPLMLATQAEDEEIIEDLQKAADETTTSKLTTGSRLTSNTLIDNIDKRIDIDSEDEV